MKTKEQRTLQINKELENSSNMKINFLIFMNRLIIFQYHKFTNLILTYLPVIFLYIHYSPHQTMSETIQMVAICSCIHFLIFKFILLKTLWANADSIIKESIMDIEILKEFKKSRTK
jgi:hypothetical protein